MEKMYVWIPCQQLTGHGTCTDDSYSLSTVTLAYPPRTGIIITFLGLPSGTVVKNLLRVRGPGSDPWSGN